MLPLLDIKSTHDSDNPFAIAPGASDPVFYTLHGHTVFGVPSGARR